MQQTLHKIKISFLFFLELQLLISIVMLPILIAWGLPISIMTIIGNLVFAQFLTIFIFISALLFASDLLGISNTYLIIILEWITNTWYYFLSFGSVHWLVGYPSQLLLFSFFLACTACALYIKRIFTQQQRILILIILTAMLPLAKIAFEPSYIHTIITQGKQKFYIIKKDGIVYAFDCGALGARPSSQSWIEYTLTPHMIKSMGATHIDMLIMCKSNSRTAKALQALMDHIPVSRCISIHTQKTPVSIQS